MGKKNKKSRRNDDDDLLGPPPSALHDGEERDDDDDAAGTNAAPAAPEAEAEAPSSTKSKKKKGGTGRGITPRDVDVDPTLLEAAMTDVLRDHGEDRPDDWLVRTVEKNMCLPKHSLKRNVDPDVLEGIMARVRLALEREFEETAEERERWEGLMAEMCGRTMLSKEDERKLREGSTAAGVDPDEAVASVMETIAAAKREVAGEIVETEDGDDYERETDDDIGGLDAEIVSLSASILLALQQYLGQSSSSNHSSFEKLFLLSRQFICRLLYAALSLLLGRQAKTDANRIYERVHLPSIEAANLEKERGDDERMLRARRHWERWSKNLKTRTKAMKQAEAAGLPIPAFARGTFVPVRAGDGWASAPGQPEAERDEIIASGVRFFVCLPGSVTETDGEHSLEITDATSWAVKTLLSGRAARELEAVDSGRELFSVDVTSMLPSDKKGKKRGRSKKNIKGKKREDDVEGKEADSVDRKGVGCTVRFSKRYLDRIQEYQGSDE